MELILIKNQLLQSASYIIGDLLVDCGDGYAILKAAEEKHIEIKGILLTHCHLDHIYGLPVVMNKFPDAKLYCSAVTHIGLQDDSLNLMYIMPEYAFEFCYNENVVELNEGLNCIDGVDVEMIICKGHSNDCHSYVIGDFLFTGDAHIPHAKVFAKWPTSDKILAIESDNKLLQLAEQRKLTILPGHWK